MFEKFDSLDIELDVRTFYSYLIHFNDKCLNPDSRGNNTTFWPPLKTRLFEPLRLCFVLEWLQMQTLNLTTPYLWILRVNNLLTVVFYYLLQTNSSLK